MNGVWTGSITSHTVTLTINMKVDATTDVYLGNNVIEPTSVSGN